MTSSRRDREQARRSFRPYSPEWRWNTNLDHYNTVYWDKRAWALGKDDLTKATITHWLYGAAVPSDTAFSTPVAHSVQRPLEHRVWYAYPGQATGTEDEVGWWKEPGRVGRCRYWMTIRPWSAAAPGLL